MVEVPGSSKAPGDEPPANGQAVDKKAKEPRDPAELVMKGIDPQVEMAVLLLQGRALGQAEKASSATPATAPAQRPAGPEAAGKARS
jgi:hypothetical protein